MTSFDEQDYLDPKHNAFGFEHDTVSLDLQIPRQGNQKQTRSESTHDASFNKPGVNIVSDVETSGLRVRVYNRAHSETMTQDEVGNLLSIQRIDPDLFQVEDLEMFAFMSGMRHVRDVLSGNPNAHQSEDFKTVPVRAWFRHVVQAGRVRHPQAMHEQNAFLNQMKNDTLRTRTGRALLLGGCVALAYCLQQPRFRTCVKQNMYDQNRSLGRFFETPVLVNYDTWTQNQDLPWQHLQKVKSPKSGLQLVFDRDVGLSLQPCFLGQIQPSNLYCLGSPAKRTYVLSVPYYHEIFGFKAFQKFHRGQNQNEARWGLKKALKPVCARHSHFWTTCLSFTDSLPSRLQGAFLLPPKVERYLASPRKVLLRNKRVRRLRKVEFDNWVAMATKPLFPGSGLSVRVYPFVKNGVGRLQSHGGFILPRQDLNGKSKTKLGWASRPWNTDLSDQINLNLWTHDTLSRTFAPLFYRRRWHFRIYNTLRVHSGFFELPLAEDEFDPERSFPDEAANAYFDHPWWFLRENCDHQPWKPSERKSFIDQAIRYTGPVKNDKWIHCLHTPASRYHLAFMLDTHNLTSGFDRLGFGGSALPPSGQAMVHDVFHHRPTSIRALKDYNPLSAAVDSGVMINFRNILRKTMPRSQALFASFCETTMPLGWAKTGFMISPEFGFDDQIKFVENSANQGKLLSFKRALWILSRPYEDEIKLRLQRHILGDDRYHAWLLSPRTMLGDLRRSFKPAYSFMNQRQTSGFMFPDQNRGERRHSVMPWFNRFRGRDAFLKRLPGVVTQNQTRFVLCGGQERLVSNLELIGRKMLTNSAPADLANNLDNHVQISGFPVTFGWSQTDGARLTWNPKNEHRDLMKIKAFRRHAFDAAQEKTFASEWGGYRYEKTIYPQAYENTDSVPFFEEDDAVSDGYLPSYPLFGIQRFVLGHDHAGNFFTEDRFGQNALEYANQPYAQTWSFNQDGWSHDMHYGLHDKGTLDMKDVSQPGEKPSFEMEGHLLHRDVPNLDFMTVLSRKLGPNYRVISPDKPYWERNKWTVDGLAQHNFLVLHPGSPLGSNMLLLGLLVAGRFGYVFVARKQWDLWRLVNEYILRLTWQCILPFFSMRKAVVPHVRVRLRHWVDTDQLFWGELRASLLYVMEERKKKLSTHANLWLPPILGEQTNVYQQANRGFLLVGPPGNGKTFLVKVFAGEARVPVIVYGAEDYIPYFDVLMYEEADVEEFLPDGRLESAEMILNVFESARYHAPCVVLVDEIDGLARKRIETETRVSNNNFFYTKTGFAAERQLEYNRSYSHWRQRGDYGGYLSHQDALSWSVSNPHMRNDTYFLNMPTVSRRPYQGSRLTYENLPTKYQSIRTNQQNLTNLLMSLDGPAHSDEARNFVVFGATNRPWMLDPALTRAGRLQTVLFLDLPGRQKRIELMKSFANNMIADGIDWDLLSRRTQNFSVAALEAGLNFSLLRNLARGKAQNLPLREQNHTMQSINNGLHTISNALFFRSPSYRTGQVNMAFGFPPSLKLQNLIWRQKGWTPSALTHAYEHRVGLVLPRNHGLILACDVHGNWQKANHRRVESHWQRQKTHYEPLSYHGLKPRARYAIKRWVKDPKHKTYLTLARALEKLTNASSNALEAESWGNYEQSLSGLLPEKPDLVQTWNQALRLGHRLGAHSDPVWTELVQTGLLGKRMEFASHVQSVFLSAGENVLEPTHIYVNMPLDGAQVLEQSFVSLWPLSDPDDLMDWNLPPLARGLQAQTNYFGDRAYLTRSAYYHCSRALIRYFLNKDLGSVPTYDVMRNQTDRLPLEDPTLWVDRLYEQCLSKEDFEVYLMLTLSGKVGETWFLHTRGLGQTETHRSSLGFEEVRHASWLLDIMLEHNLFLDSGLDLRRKTWVGHSEKPLSQRLGKNRPHNENDFIPNQGLHNWEFLRTDPLEDLIKEHMGHEHFDYESTLSDLLEHNDEEEQKMRRIGLGDLFWFENRNVPYRLKAFYEGFYPSRDVLRWPSRSVNEGHHASLVPKQMRILDVPCPPQPDVSMVWNRLNQQKRDELRTSALSRVYTRLGRVLQENRQVLDVLVYHLLKNQRMEEVEMFALIDRLLEPNLENLTVVPDPIAMAEDVAHAQHQRLIHIFAFEESLVPPLTPVVSCDPNFGDSMDVTWDDKVALRKQYAWMAQRAAEDNLPVLPDDQPSGYLEKAQTAPRD